MTRLYNTFLLFLFDFCFCLFAVKVHRPVDPAPSCFLLETEPSLKMAQASLFHETPSPSDIIIKIIRLLALCLIHTSVTVTFTPLRTLSIYRPVPLRVLWGRNSYWPILISSVPSLGFGKLGFSESLLNQCKAMDVYVTATQCAAWHLSNLSDCPLNCMCKALLSWADIILTFLHGMCIDVCKLFLYLVGYNICLPIMSS